MQFPTEIIEVAKFAEKANLGICIRDNRGDEWWSPYALDFFGIYSDVPFKKVSRSLIGNNVYGNERDKFQFIGVTNTLSEYSYHVEVKGKKFKIIENFVRLDCKDFMVSTLKEISNFAFLETDVYLDGQSGVRYRDVVDSFESALVVIDNNETVISFNKSFIDLVGVSPTLLKGLVFSDISKLQPADNFLVIMDAIFENENLVEIPNEGQNQFFKIDQGSIYKNEFETGVSIQITDVTESILEARAVQQQVFDLQKWFSTIQYPIGEMEVTGEIIRSNESFERFWGAQYPFWYLKTFIKK